MTKFLAGHGIPPFVVGAVRGAVLAGGIAIVEALITTLTSANLPSTPWLIIAPFIVAGLRAAEGALDGFKQAPPAVPAAAPAAPKQ